MQNRPFIPGEERTHDVDDMELPQSPKKILVLDDDPNLTEVLRVFLELEGYQVAVVHNGVEGVKMVMGESFDLILCDMVMPNMRGDMFYKAVERTKPRLCKRFVFMTGHQTDKEVNDFIRGIRGLVLWKPFEMHQLTEAIGLILKKIETGKA
ncbi:MAG: two-component system NtrC family sensor kinase [Limisphaerales bacterium]|jgi:two-component system NtrC family sensor kinase